MTTERRSGRRMVATALGVVVVVALSGGAFVVLDVVVAAAVATVLVTTLVLLVAASGWDQYSTYEERELARARRRQEKWDRATDARARDRAKWEAHQARRAGAPDSGR